MEMRQMTKITIAWELLEQGIPKSHIAKHLSVSRQTIIRWSQLKANITGYEVAIPSNEEAACLGAAIIGAVSEGVFQSYEEEINECISIKKQFLPKEMESFSKKHILFRNLYEALASVF